MNRKKAFLWIEALLCILLCAVLITGALRLYIQGGAGNEWIYTREKAAGALRPALPLLAAVLVLAAAIRSRGDCGDDRDLRINVSWQSMEKPGPKREVHARAIRWALLIAAAGLIAAGILNGSMRDVLYKAINICTECVGLG